jgi:hypothetical protein
MEPSDFGWHGMKWAFYAGWQKSGCQFKGCTLHSWDAALTFYVGWTGCKAATNCTGQRPDYAAQKEKVSIDCFALVGAPKGPLAENPKAKTMPIDPKGIDEEHGGEGAAYTAKCKAAALELKMNIMELKKHANPNAMETGVTFDTIKQVVDGGIATMQEYSDKKNAVTISGVSDESATYELGSSKTEMADAMTEVVTKEFGPLVTEMTGLGNKFEFEALVSAVGCITGAATVAATGGSAVVSGSLTPCVTLVTSTVEHYLKSLNDDRTLDTDDSEFRTQINFYMKLVIRLRDLKDYITYDKMSLTTMQQVSCGVHALNDYYYKARAVKDKEKEAEWVMKHPYKIFQSYGHQLETSMLLESMKLSLPDAAKKSKGPKSNGDDGMTTAAKNKIKAASLEGVLSPPK